jgi:hypothetical protein
MGATTVLFSAMSRLSMSGLVIRLSASTNCKTDTGHQRGRQAWSVTSQKNWGQDQGRGVMRTLAAPLCPQE